jgi:mannonate dehydratase
MPLTHGRKYTEQELWDNYEYFIRQAAPVAEEAGVMIGIHPDDPPVPVLAGVPRCIFSSFDGYKRALEIANSPNVGICLCCGTWLEGGRKLTGKDPEEMIRYFGAGKIWKIHFRNVSASLPHFVETFMDNGYYDMWKIMKALREVNFDGIVILDHSPILVGNTYAQTAYGIAYMRALLNRANALAES